MAGRPTRHRRFIPSSPEVIRAEKDCVPYGLFYGWRRDFCGGNIRSSLVRGDVCDIRGAGWTAPFTCLLATEPRTVLTASSDGSPTLHGKTQEEGYGASEREEGTSVLWAPRGLVLSFAMAVSFSPPPLLSHGSPEGLR